MARWQVMAAQLASRCAELAALSAPGGSHPCCCSGVCPASAQHRPPGQRALVAALTGGGLLPCTSPGAEISELELSDGWYAIKAALDPPLQRLVQEGRLQVGQGPPPLLQQRLLPARWGGVRTPDCLARVGGQGCWQRGVCRGGGGAQRRGLQRRTSMGGPAGGARRCPPPSRPPAAAPRAGGVQAAGAGRAAAGGPAAGAAGGRPHRAAAPGLQLVHPGGLGRAAGAVRGAGLLPAAAPGAPAGRGRLQHGGGGAAQVRGQQGQQGPAGRVSCAVALLCPALDVPGRAAPSRLPACLPLPSARPRHAAGSRCCTASGSPAAAW
jgi:hypothetical protein